MMLFIVRSFFIQDESAQRVKGPNVLYPEPSRPQLATGISAGGGLQYLSTTEREEYFNTAAELRAKWVRFDFAWWDIQEAGPSSYDWSKYDAVVAAAAAKDINVLGMVGYTPEWARPATCSDDKCAPEDPTTYAAFVKKVVERYKTRGVSHWEIWNEPNNTVFWKPKPNVKDYASLLTLAYAAAKQADPSATIISGGLSPATNTDGNIAPIDFTEALYAEKAGESFDAFGFHPYCYSGTFNCPADYAEWSAWSQMNDTPRSIRSIMKKNDDDKKIWVTEFGAPTNGPNSVTEKLQANMVRRSYEQLSRQSWAGTFFWYSLQDIGSDNEDVEDWFGLIDANGRKKASFDVFKEISRP